jgi:hypothetical protein
VAVGCAAQKLKAPTTTIVIAKAIVVASNCCHVSDTELPPVQLPAVLPFGLISPIDVQKP